MLLAIFAHELYGSFFEPFNSSRSPASYVCLQSPIDVLIRVQFGTVGRHKEQFDPIIVSLRQPRHQLTLVHSQIVDNQEDLARLILNQVFQEFDERLLIHRFVLYLEAQQPLI